jgi:hypothetical protein
MSTSDQEQMSQFVRQRKRMAMGEKLDGTSYAPKGGAKPTEKKAGGLASAKKK